MIRYVELFLRNVLKQGETVLGGYYSERILKINPDYIVSIESSTIDTIDVDKKVFTREVEIITVSTGQRYVVSV